MAANPQPAPSAQKRNCVPTETLQRLYFDDGLHLAKVGKTVGMTGAGVKHRLMHAGFTLRSRPKSPVVPIEVLRRLYFDQALSTGKVAKQVGISISAVRQRLLGAGYKLRQRRRLSREAEKDLIAGYTEGLTMAELVTRTGVSFSVIQRSLKAAGASRPHGYALQGIWDERKKKLTKVEEAERELAKAQELAKAAAASAAAARAELDTARQQSEPQDVKIARKVKEAIVKFETLFSLPELHPDPRRKLMNGWTHPDFSSNQIAAALDAAISRKPETEWPKLAAYSCVELETRIDRKTIRVYFSRAKEFV